MEFDEVPVCQFVSSLNFSPAENEVIDAEISKLLSKGVIVNTTREPNDYVSGIFARTKKDDNYRMVLNLKTFNEFLKFKHCKQAFMNYNFSHMRFCARKTVLGERLGTWEIVHVKEQTC